MRAHHCFGPEGAENIKPNIEVQELGSTSPMMFHHSQGSIKLTKNISEELEAQFIELSLILQPDGEQR